MKTHEFNTINSNFFDPQMTFWDDIADDFGDKWRKMNFPGAALQLLSL